MLSGWRVSVTGEWQSGQPFTVRTGVDSGGSGIPVAWRPDYNANGRLWPDAAENNLRTFRNDGVFVTPLTPGGLPLPNSMPAGGNLGRNTLRGPGLVQVNLSLTKEFSLSKKGRLQIRCDMFNAFNHRDFGNPIATMNAGSAFGTNTSDPGARSILLKVGLGF